jgi:TolB-like protein
MTRRSLRFALRGLPVAVVLAAGFLSLSGCGYRLAGGSSVLPDHIEAIAVMPFANRTERPEIDQRVTESVAEELTRRGGYKVVTDRQRGDAVLEGTVTSYKTTPVQLTAAGRASRVETRVILSAVLRDRVSDEVLWSQEGLSFSEQYDVSQFGEFVDEETAAMEDIASGAAGVLVTSILEGF